MLITRIRLRRVSPGPSISPRRTPPLRPRHRRRPQAPARVLASHRRKQGARLRAVWTALRLLRAQVHRITAGLAAGSHNFQVRAIDAAGNVDTTPASHTWTINALDTTPPDTTITSSPPITTNSTSASFSFTSTEAGKHVCLQPRRQRFHGLHERSELQLTGHGKPHFPSTSDRRWRTIPIRRRRVIRGRLIQFHQAQVSVLSSVTIRSPLFWTRTSISCGEPRESRCVYG